MEDKIVKSTIIYTALGLLPLSFSLLFTPIYLRYLNPEEYGILNLFSIYGGILASIYTLGVNSAFGFIYWDYYKDKKKVHHLLASTIGLILILQLIIFTIGLIFGNTILNFILTSPEIFPFYPFGLLTLIYPVFTVFYELFLPYFRNEGKIKSYASLSISTLFFLTLGSVLGIIVFNLKAEGAIIGRTIGYAVVVICFLIHFIFKVGIYFNKKLSKDLLKFGFPLMLSTIIGSVSYSMDRILVDRFSSIKDLGIYGLAIVIASVLEIWFNALNNALSPTIFKYMKDNIEGNKLKIQTLSHTIIFSVFLAATVLIIVAKPLVELIAPEEYFDCIKYIPLLVIALNARVFSSIKSYIFYRNSVTKKLPIIQIINLILTILFSYFLFKALGIIGIAIAVVVVKNIEVGIVNYYANKINPFCFGFKNLQFISLSLICAVLILTYLSFHVESYLIYFIPFTTLIILSPILAKKELTNVINLLKNER